MKKTNMLQTVCCKSKLYLQRSSPTILTCVAAAGVVATAIMAVKATPKAMILLEKATDEKGESLTKPEIIRVAGPVYIPSTLIGLSTIVCMFEANVLSKRQQAALVSAYALVNNSYNEYKNKVKELYGEESDVRIRAAIAKDKYTGDVKPDNSEELLFFDEFSNRYFWRTMEEVKDAEYHFNRNFALRGNAELNEFYEFLGLEPTEYGTTVGWSLGAGDAFYGYSWIDFHHEFHESDNPDMPSYYSICMPFPPTADYMDW